MKKILRLSQSGFTLVELLIVITILAILSVAVLSTLNPIEQANKATDSRNKNDAAEILSAIERYYASKQEYPWNSVLFTTPVNGSDPAVGFNARDPGLGLCSGTDLTSAPTCTSAAPGLLIDNDELKTTFLNKGFMQSGLTWLNTMYLYKEFGSGGGIHVCFVPKAKANRTVSSTNLLYMLTFTSNEPSDIKQAIVGTSAMGDYATGLCPVTSSSTWSSSSQTDNICYVCVP